jgi:cytochrome P450
MASWSKKKLAMRIYPPVPTLSGRVVPPPGDIVDGNYPPGGTVIHLVQYAAYNLSQNFERRYEFILKRWTKEGIEGEFRGDKRDVDRPFSVGPRNCIGKNLAYAEMRLILARLRWRFNLSVPKG